MKNIIFLLLCLFTFTLRASENNTLYWYVAASLSKAAKKITENFNSQKHSFKVMIIPGGSGELISQICLSEKGDLFTPASDEFMSIIKAKNIVKSYQKFIKQTPVFALARKFGDKNMTFDELSNGNYKIAIGNPKTMAAALAYQEIERKMPADVAAKIREHESGSPLDLNQSLSYLEMNTIDAALLFDTMARANHLAFVKIPEKYNIENYAYLAELKSESSDENTKEFISFIFNHKDVFKEYGYKLMDKEIE